MMRERIEGLDVASAIQDCLPFVRDQEAISNGWSKEFFLHCMEKNRFQKLAWLWVGV